MAQIFDESLMSEEYRKYREDVNKIQRILLLILIAISFGAGYLAGVMQP